MYVITIYLRVTFLTSSRRTLWLIQNTHYFNGRVGYNTRASPLFFCDHENANEIWCNFWALLICIIYVHCDKMLLCYKEDSKQQQPHSNIVSFTITFMADWTLHKGGEKMCPVIAPRWSHILHIVIHLAPPYALYPCAHGPAYVVLWGSWKGSRACSFLLLLSWWWTSLYEIARS